MGTVKFPLSGNVTQSILPWSWMFNGGQYGLINIELGRSSNPEVEAEILSDVASYGKQLGRIEDVLAMLAAKLPREDLSESERVALDDFNEMMTEIKKVKVRGRQGNLRNK